MDNKNQEIQSIKNLEQYRKDYVGNISHELKTPLTSVQGYIHTLLEDVESPTLRRRFLEKAANNTERLIQIVNDLETITKIESGNIIIEFQTFNLKQLLEEVIDDLTFMTSEKQLKIQFIDGNISSYLALGDKESIRQVLNNLVINSIKYGKDNGNTTIKLYDMVDDFLIEINDNGLGIDSKHLPHIFDRFYRIDKSRNRNIGGSGLGLSIVKHIIEAHGQAITVVSELDKGTRFTFSLSKG
jgi:two-component system phosphate regulon sensor histidine kinase PhoR